MNGAKHLPEVVVVALSCSHEKVMGICIFKEEDKEIETKGRRAGGERHGKTLAMCMHRGTMRLYTHTMDSKEPRGLSVGKVTLID